MKAKIGRPKSENPRNQRLELKLTKSELEKINNCSKKMERSRTDTILYGIELIEKSNL